MIKCAAPSGDGVSRALVTGHGSSSSCALTVDPWPGASCAHRTQPPRPPAEQAALSPLLPTEEPDVPGFPSRTGLAGGAGGLTGLAGGVGGVPCTRAGGLGPEPMLFTERQHVRWILRDEWEFDEQWAQ